MKRRVGVAVKIVLWVITAGVTYAVCALIVLAAAACTAGTSDVADRGIAGTPAETGWEVTNFAADYVIDPRGTLHATEQITVDFHNLSKHGIYRDLYWRVDCQPARVSTEPRESFCTPGGLRTYDIAVKGVTTPDGRPLRYAVSRIGDTEQGSAMLRPSSPGRRRTSSGTPWLGHWLPTRTTTSCTGMRAAGGRCPSWPFPRKSPSRPARSWKRRASRGLPSPARHAPPRRARTQRQRSVPLRRWDAPTR